MDVANIYDSKNDIKELDKLDVKLISVIDTIEELIKQGKELNSLFSKGTPKEYASAMSQLNDVLSRLAKTERDLLDLTSKYDKIAQNNNNTTRQSTKATGELGNQTALLREKKRLLNKEGKDQAVVEIQNQQLLNASLGLYNKVQLKLNALTVKYNELAIKKQLGLKLSAAEEKSYNNLSAKIQKYDTILKGVDASVGKYSRNVGNYASGFDPLSNSINQLAREAPAFANSLQTGFMAISNNLPIFFDAVGNIIKQNKILKEEGKPTQSVLKQIATSLFSFQTLLSIGVTLLTIYGPELWKWTKAMIAGSGASAAAAKNQEDLNKSRQEGLKSAASEVSQLKILYRVAQDTALSTEQRMRAVRKLQDLYPSYFANLSSETIMTGKATAQYKELTGAIIASAQARAIEKILSDRMEKSLLEEERLTNNLNQSIKEAAKIKKSGLTESRLVSDGQGGLIKKEIANQTLLSGAVYKVGVNMRALDKFRKKAAADNETLIQRQIQLQEQAAKYESDKYGKDAPKAKSSSGLTKEQRDYLDTLAAIRDTEIAISKERRFKNEIDEKQYWERYIQIIKTYKSKVENYLNGANGAQRKIEASVRKKAIEEIVKANKEIYDYEKMNLDSFYKMKQEVTERKLNEINNDEYSFEIEKIQKRNDIYNLQIADTNKYYDDLLKSAKKYSQEYIAIEAERDDKIGAIQDKQNNNNSNINNAIREQIEYYQKIEDAYRTTSDLEERRVILANSKLSISERDYLISVKEKDQEIEMLQLQQKRLQLEAAGLEAKAVNLKLSTAESSRLAEINTQLADINLAIEERKQIRIDIEWRKLKENLSPTIDYIRNSFNNLGLDNLANNFDKVLDDIGRRFKETGKIAFTFKDAAILAASAVADALTQISTAQKERTIADLDEQLKRSQEITDQEVGFINKRLEMLNAIQDKTAEQTQERNRLEDEARGMREQQAMREKLIEKQKAKAEQRAAAQQALINGGLAATKTLATLGVPAGLLPAGIALGFGVLQAGLIMSKNPVPQYFVGTNHASEGWALTQERGAEIITDKSGNIKTWGNNRGAQMTYMQEGDRVLTAFESQDFKKKIKDVSIPDNLFLNYARESILPSIIIPKQEDNSQKIIDGVEKAFERVFGKYDKTNVYENENGDLVIERGTKIPEVRKKKKPKTPTIIIQKPNVRD